MNIPPVLGALLSFIAGACVGSFVNVVAYRLPREISIVTPRSFCPHCNRTIPFWANIPILAYLTLRGRCHACGGAIAFRNFLGELALAATGGYLYLSFPLPDAIARFALCAALFIVALIDYDWRVIPNAITFPGTAIGFLAATLMTNGPGWKSSLGGVLLGAGFLFATGELYRLIRGREGVGMGDVWLLAMTGAFLGWAGALFTMFVGSMLGAVGGIAFAFTGGAPSPPQEPLPAAIAAVIDIGADETADEGPASILQTAVPFGPFLAIAAACFALFEPQLAHWYFSP